MRASVSGGELIVSVIDNGIGIAPESLPRLFEMFSQIRSRDDRATDGMGDWGWPSRRRLVELHGGSIDAHSAGVGRGSTFVVRVPIGTDLAAS